MTSKRMGAESTHWTPSKSLRLRPYQPHTGGAKSRSSHLRSNGTASDSATRPVKLSRNSDTTAAGALLSTRFVGFVYPSADGDHRAVLGPVRRRPDQACIRIWICKCCLIQLEPTFDSANRPCRENLPQKPKRPHRRYCISFTLQLIHRAQK